MRRKKALDPWSMSRAEWWETASLSLSEWLRIVLHSLCNCDLSSFGTTLTDGKSNRAESMYLFRYGPLKF